MNQLIELVLMLERAEFLINEAGRISCRGDDSGMTPGEFARERVEWLADYEKMMGNAGRRTGKEGTMGDKQMQCARCYRLYSLSDCRYDGTYPGYFCPDCGGAVAFVGLNPVKPPTHDDETVPPEAKQLDPHRTILVCRVDGREVGRKPATSPNANEWLQEMDSRYARDGKTVTVDYETDETAGLLATIGL